MYKIEGRKVEAESSFLRIFATSANKQLKLTEKRRIFCHQFLSIFFVGERYEIAVERNIKKALPSEVTKSIGAKCELTWWFCCGYW
jgi:hypothetical protein